MMFIAQLPVMHSGLTLAVKDNIDVVIGMGSAAFKGTRRASKTAKVVENLIAADFQLISKLVMHELAFGMTGII